MKCKLTFALSLVTISCFAPSLQAQQAETEKMASQVCATCHGPRGDSISPAFPRLAGQRVEYLESQLKAFRDRTRGDPMAQAYMWGMTSQLNDDAIAKLAAYYSGQKPVRGQAADAKLAQAGRTIYEQGIPAANVQACVACHGKDAEGSAVFPRLAGQHTEYLVKQLVLFKSQLRSDANAPIMHTVSTGITFNQMEAVAAYLASK
ncbi:MAG: c-type cytochrome [Burkholderiales bacterium]